MHITHYGHACVLLDTGSARLLTATQLAAFDHEVMAPGTSFEAAGAHVDVLGGQHAVIHPDIPVIVNNSYLVDGTVLHPGDAFTPPPSPVDVLLLPTGAPWLKLADAVDYLRAVAPRTAVPIHEAVLAMPQMHYGMFENLKPEGTVVRVLDRGEATVL